MNVTSEYAFPIFISSTDYNLKDLRAELADFLRNLGYRPSVSSAEGFPDNSPNLAPWESCLPVLDQAFVVILIIDGRYGTLLSWPNFPDLTDKKVSPTHAEYLYAHKNRKRLLVFIRKEVMTYYQSYRNALDKAKDEAEAEAALKITLPPYVDYNTLKFVEQVKTEKPIPWINEFEDVTQIKKEVQKKMLNELAEIFLIKTLHHDTVVKSFNQVMQSLSTENQKKILEGIPLAKDLLIKAENRETLQKELEEKEKSLAEVKEGNEEEKKKRETEIEALQAKLKEYEKEKQSRDNPFYVKDGKIQANYDSSLLKAIRINLSDSPVTFAITDYDALLSNDRCDKCKNRVPYATSILNPPLNHCASCGRNLCNDCWPHPKSSASLMILGPQICQDCLNGEKAAS